jgi:Ca2+-binding RTX toxin-like protein
MGTAHVDTLSSGGFTNDFLIGNGGLDILNGGAGIDNFVVALTALDPLNPTANLATINNITLGSDKILVDVADVSGNMGASQAINAATQFQSGAGGPTVTSFNEAGGATDKFYYDTTGQNLWYSADGGAHAIEIAHLATGIPPAAAAVAAAVHTF